MNKLFGLKKCFISVAAVPFDFHVHMPRQAYRLIHRLIVFAMVGCKFSYIIGWLGKEYLILI